MRTISRLLFGGLVLFELLNQFDLLHFSLDFTWLGLALTSIIAWFFIEGASYLLKKTSGQPMSGLIFLIALIAVYVDALGDILHFYARFSWYDALAHSIGGAAAAGLIFFIIWTLGQSKKIKIGVLGTGFVSLTTVSFLGGLYEIEEYLEDMFTGSHRLGDGPDTANDLLLNTLGALFIIGLITIYLYKRHKIAAKNP